MIATINYPLRWGGQLADRRYWMAVVDGEVYDYNTLPELKRLLDKDGIPWQVVRTHRDGTTSVIESSQEPS